MFGSNKKILEEYQINEAVRLEKIKNLEKDVQLTAATLLEKNKELQEIKETHNNLRSEIAETQQERDKVYAGNKGLMEEINFLKFRLDETSLLHDQVVLNQWEKNSKKDFVCLHPFERIDILPRGEVYTCCSADLKHDFLIGNIYKDDINDIWNSENAKKLRYSTAVGNFEYCNRFCRWLKGGISVSGEGVEEESPIRKRDSVKEIKEYSEYQQCHMEKMPKRIMLSCDESCNLKCASCRTGLKVMSDEESDKLYSMLMKTVRPMLVDCENLTSLGTGDIFASKAIMKFYKTLTHSEFPNLTLHIMTNAQLFNSALWEKLTNFHDFPIMFNISVDAAKKETYEQLRYGGKWETLQNNLKFVESLKEKGNIKKLRLNFIVQKINFEEMEDFVKMAIKFKANDVNFQSVGNWGTYCEEEYTEINVANKDHELFPKLKEICQKIQKNYGDKINIMNNFSF